MSRVKRKIDWLNHSLEFFVVIIGILIAFQLNKCSSENEQGKTIDIHMSQIAEETKLNKKSFQAAIAADELNIAKLDSIIKLVQEGKQFRKINFLALELLNIGGVYIRKNAYQSLVESGDIRFMRSFKDKNKIINLYEYYTWVESFNTISFELYSADYYPYLKKNFNLLTGEVQEPEVYLTKEFLNILGAYHRTSSNRLQKYRDCLIEIEKYLTSSH